MVNVVIGSRGYSLGWSTRLVGPVLSTCIAREPKPEQETIALTLVTDYKVWWTSASEVHYHVRSTIPYHTMPCRHGMVWYSRV